MRQRLLAALFAAAAPALPVVAEDLFVNRTFTSNLSGWTVPSYSTGVWSSFDHGGGSGSALLTSNPISGNAPNTAIQQCVAVTAGRVYAFGASIWIPSDVAAGALITPGLDVRFYPGAGCSGGELDQRVAGAVPVLRDTWIDIQARGKAPAGSGSALGSFGGVDYAGSATLETIKVYVDDAYFESDANCVTTGSHLCLGGRFLVYGDWAVPSQGRSGYMRAVPVTADSGLFWFFSLNNLEVFTKVVNACTNPFNHYWAFVSGLTDVQTVLHVDDTVSGERREYYNSAGTAFAPVQDTSAFATCP
jgi:hypothetical protein